MIEESYRTESKEGQRVYAYFDWTSNRENPHLPDPPTEAEIKEWMRSNECPLSKVIVGENNKANMKLLEELIFIAHSRHDHSLRGCGQSFYGQSGQGKTYVARKVAEAAGIPFILIQSKAIKDTWMLFQEICETFKRHRFSDGTTTPIVPHPTTKADFAIPPCYIFFDEAHALAKSLQEGALLNATEPSDGYMVCVKPGAKKQTVMVNCKHVCWSLATTERGRLFGPFANRFGTEILWQNAGGEEMAKMVKLKMDEEFERGDHPFIFPEHVGEAIYKYEKVPREANDFARNMIRCRNYSNCSWEDAVEIVRQRMTYDEWGWTRKQVDVVKACGQRPVSRRVLVRVAGCQEEELDNRVLPLLTSYNEGGPILVSTSRGMTITRLGQEELNKRGIRHAGAKVTVEFFDARRNAA